MSPARRHRPRRPTRAQTRARVLAAAREVFAERGIAAATLDDVAGAAGLTKGAVYSNFTGKDGLILALMEERVSERIEAVAAAFAAAENSAGGVRDAGATLIASVHADADWQRLFIEFWGRAMRDDALREVLVERRRALRRTIAQALDRGAADHGLMLALPADHLAVTILALSNGLAIESLLDPDAVPSELFGRLLAQLVDF